MSEQDFMSDNIMGGTCFFQEQNPDIFKLCVTKYQQKFQTFNLIYLCFINFSIMCFKIICTKLCNINIANSNIQGRYILQISFQKSLCSNNQLLQQPVVIFHIVNALREFILAHTFAVHCRIILVLLLYTSCIFHILE